MFKPHHSCVCKDVYVNNANALLIPELWISLDDISVMQEIENKGFAVGVDGKPIHIGSDLVITRYGIFEFLHNMNYISYTIFADEEYLKEVPVFFQDEWDSEVKFESMSLLGWTVNKFTEPALLYGDFPIKPILKGDEIIGYDIVDTKIINKWGLIDKYEDALKIASKNSEEDLYNEKWRPLAVCVDIFTFNKLNSKNYIQSETNTNQLT